MTSSAYVGQSAHRALALPLCISRKPYGHNHNARRIAAVVRVVWHPTGIGHIIDIRFATTDLFWIRVLQNKITPNQR